MQQAFPDKSPTLPGILSVLYRSGEIRLHGDANGLLAGSGALTRDHPLLPSSPTSGVLDPL